MNVVISIYKLARTMYYVCSCCYKNVCFIVLRVLLIVQVLVLFNMNARIYTIYFICKHLFLYLSYYFFIETNISVTIVVHNIK